MPGGGAAPQSSSCATETLTRAMHGGPAPQGPSCAPRDTDEERWQGGSTPRGPGCAPRAADESHAWGGCTRVPGRAPETLMKSDGGEGPAPRGPSSLYPKPSCAPHTLGQVIASWLC